MSERAAEQPRRRRRRRKLLFVAIALAVGVVLALALVEVSFRLFWKLPPWLAEISQAGMYAAADDDGTPMLLPGYAGTLELDEGVVTTVRINDLGMRGPAPEPGGTRVLVVGDSMVFGYGVDAEQALPATLERALQQRGVDAVCGNAGVPGFGPRRYAEHLERMDCAFGADAFVVCVCLGNDALDDTSPRTIIYNGLKFHGIVAQHVQTSWRMRLAMRSRAALWFENWVFTNRREWSPMSDPLPFPEELALQAGFPGKDRRHACLFLDVRDEATAWPRGAPPVVPRVLGLLREALERMLAHAGERPLVLVLLPTLYHVDAALWSQTLAGMEFDVAAFEQGAHQRRLLETARQAGVAAFDAGEVVAAAPDPAGLYLGDKGHLGVRGNQIVGNWLAAQIVGRLR